MFPKGLTEDVKIIIIDLKTGGKVNVTNEVCTKNDTLDELYTWSTNNIDLNKITNYTNLFYKMYTTFNNKEVVYYGKFVYSGYVDEPSDVDLAEVTTKQNETQDLLEIINARM